GRIDPLGIGARLPDIDAAGPRAVLAQPVVLAQQPGHALVARRGGLEGLRNVLQARRPRQTECHDGYDHRSASRLGSLKPENAQKYHAALDEPDLTEELLNHHQQSETIKRGRPNPHLTDAVAE